MLSQLLLKELDQSLNQNQKDLENQEPIEQSDNNGTIKEIKEKDLKKKDKLLKKTTDL